MYYILSTVISTFMKYFLFCSGEPYAIGSVIKDKEMGA